MAVSRLPLDDIIKGVLKAVKGGKKPPTVEQIVKMTTKKPYRNPMGPPLINEPIGRIDSAKRYSKKIYDKGSPEYKAILKKQKKDESIMKKINNPKKVSPKRASYQADYEMALKAEKHLKNIKYSVSGSPFKSDAEARKFIQNFMKKGKR